MGTLPSSLGNRQSPGKVPRAVPMQCLPPPDLADRGHDLRRDPCVAATVVPRHVSPDPEQAGRHRQVVAYRMMKGTMGGAMVVSGHDYAAMATPVTSAQVVNA